MATNNYNKYDEDFKNLSSHFTKTVNPKLSAAKNTASHNPLSVNG